MAPLQLNQNVPPYHDDFDPLKNYYKVLYKPGFPVQARELTSMQSILQDQIEVLASRILKNGDQVNAGEFGFNNKEPYVRVSSITQGSKPSDFVGYTLTGQSSGVVGKVQFAYDQVKDEEGKVTEDVTFQVQYIDAGASSEDKTFRQGEVLTSSNPNAYTAVCGIDTVSRPIDTPAMGFGCNFTVESGSYFIDGFMVRNDAETISISKYSRVPTCQVGFLVDESFVSSNDDPSLLDNSQGSSNFAAPGADRLSIQLKLVKKPLDVNEPNFIALVDIIQGNLQGKPDQSVKWAWLYDLLAQRTYDEEGDYIVRDFKVKKLEYVNSKNVDGLFDALDVTDSEGNPLYPAVPGTVAASEGATLSLQEAQGLYVLEISAGSAMVQGYQVGYKQSFYLYGNKPRDPQLNANSFTYISPGASFTLQNTSGSPDLQNITGDGVAVAFTPVLMYKQFLDGYIGTATTPITYPDGTVVNTPINRNGWGFDTTDLTQNKKPLETYHIVADGPIGDTSPLAAVYVEGNSCVVVSQAELTRGTVIGGATALIVTKVDPIPTGFLTPRYYEPRQVVNEQTGFEGFTSTYNLGILTSTFFTELLCFPQVNTNADWEIGSRIIGEISSATGIVEAVTQTKQATAVIVSNVVGSFINGETIEQAATNKTARLIRPGEVLGFDFYDKGDSNTISLGAESEIEVSALGATTTLTVADGDITNTDTDILLTDQGRDKLLNFPDTLNIDDTRVNVNLSVKTSPSGINGYAVVLPAFVTHTLQKTKSLFSGLNDVNNFSSDISVQNATDAEYLNLANDALFSGLAGQNWLTCDDFSGDASDELVAGDIVSFTTDDSNIVSKVVKFVTKPRGAGEFRDKCFIYFTTQIAQSVTGKKVQRVRIKTGGDTQQGLVYRLPEQYVKSLESNPLKTGINYQCGRQFYQNVEAGATTFTLVTNRSNEAFLTNLRSSVVIARNLSSPSDPKGFLGRLVSLSSITPQDNGRKVVFGLSEPLPCSATLKVITSVYVTNALAKKKKIQRDVKLSVPFPESAANIISLGKADIFQINYIKNVSTGRIITNNYTLDDGQRQNIYDIGRLMLKTTAPRVEQSDGDLGTLEISFDYLEHQDDGDFFSVDSYTHEDGINYELIPYYPYNAQGAASPTRQDLILDTPLRDCVDFRPVVNTLDPNESVIAQITPGVTAYDSHNFRDTTNEGNGFAPRMPLANSQFQSDIEFYVGKIDTLFLDKTGKLFIADGEQTENPIRPADIATGIRLYDLRIQPFCLHAKTNIKLKKYDYFRYGMKEIHTLDKRISRLEDVVTLSLLEQNALNMTVRDAETGLDRFKSGYIVDGFNDHSRGDVSSPYYRCAIDAKRSMLRPPFFKDQVELEETYLTDEARLVNGNYVNNGGICTAPFTESVYTENPVATRWINVQIYNTFTWNGLMQISPQIDTFTDITNLPDLNIEDNSLYDAMTAMTDGLYELGILGTVWETNQTIIQESVDWNSEEHDDVMARINSMSDVFTETQIIENEILPPTTTGRGNASRVTTEIHGAHITATGDIQVTKDLRLESGEVVQTSYGDRITNITLVETMRTIPIFWSIHNVKPNTKFYAFFDGVPVDRWVCPNSPVDDGQGGTTYPVSNPDYNGYGQPLVSSTYGTLSGVFLVPNGRPPLEQVVVEVTDPDTGEVTEELQNQVWDGYLENVQYEVNGPTRSFPTGDRVFRLTTEISNRDETLTDSDLVDSFAQATFTASGIVADKQKTVVSTRPVEIIPQREEIQSVINEVLIEQDVQRHIRRWNTDDPIAQTFEIDANHEKGIFASELEVYFRTKDDVAPVEAYLVPTEAHMPVHSIIPMSRVVVNPDTLIRVQCTLNSETETIRSGEQVTGLKSGAVGTVKSAVVFETAEDNPEQNVTNHTYTLIFNNHNGINFLPGEEVAPVKTPSSLSTWTVVEDEYSPVKVKVTDFGEDYTDATVVFSAPELPGGVTATATAKISDGKVYDIVVTNPGSGYITVPSVTIESDSGNGATAVARVINGRKAVEMGVAVSDDASAGTKFKFEAPIYLLGQETYAFVIYSPSLEYRAYTSKLGESSLDSNFRVVTQPHAGSLYKSQNNGIWTEEQTQDIMFTLKKCDFFTNTSSKVQLQNSPMRTHKINNDPIETNANLSASVDSNIFGDNPFIVTVYHDWHGLVSGDVVEINGVTGDPGGVANSHYNKLHTVLASDFRKFTIKLDKAALRTEKAGGTQVFCSYNRPFESATLKTGIIQSTGTKLVANVRTVGAATPTTPLGSNSDATTGLPVGYNEDNSYTRDTPVQVTPEQRFYFPEPKQVASSVNEAQYNDTFHLRGESSLKVTANLSTSNQDVSPVIDLTRTNMWVEKNLIEKSSKDNIIFGLVPTTVAFSTGFASDLVTDNQEVVFTTNGIEYKVLVDSFNHNTGRLLLTGKDAKHLTKSSVFADSGLSALSISRITTKDPINFVPESKNFGSTYAKWMSRRFDLDNECDGVVMKMAAVFYDTTDIRVFYKPMAAGFDGDFDDLTWIPFNVDQAAPGEERRIDSDGNIYSPGDPDYDNSQLDLTTLPTPGLCDNAEGVQFRSNAIASPEILKNSDLVELTWSFQDAAKFTAIAFKIVMEATNPAKCPLIDDIRVVASE